MSHPVELIRSLAALAEAPAPEHERLCRLLGFPPPPGAASHTALFEHQVYPYASVYLGAEGMLGGDARSRVAGFWSAVGQEPPADCDHVSNLLTLWSALLERADGETDPARARLSLRAAEALVSEHLAPWVFVFLEAIRGVVAREGGRSSFFHAWADTLEQLVWGAAPAGGGGLPVHLSVAAELPEPADVGGEAFLDALLAPVRCGMVLTRADVTRMTASLEIGSRVAERRYTLRACLAQDAAGVLGWLADEADRWTQRHRSPDPAVSAFWKDRARHAAATLRQAAVDASAGIAT